MANEKKELIYDEYTVTHHVTLEGIQLDSELACKLYKKLGKTFDDLWNTLTKEIDIKDEFLTEIIELVNNNFKEVWEQVSPLTVQDILKNNNAEQRFYLLSQIDMEEFEEISEVINEQTLVKKQQKTEIAGYVEGQKPKFVYSNSIQLKNIEYSDTYTLLKINKDVLQSREDVYMVKCKDTSTDRIYYLYVNGNEGNTQIRTDAIAAIASTMVNPDGSIFTKEQYLQLMAEA